MDMWVWGGENGFTNCWRYMWGSVVISYIPIAGNSLAASITPSGACLGSGCFDTMVLWLIRSLSIPSESVNSSIIIWNNRRIYNYFWLFEVYNCLWSYAFIYKDWLSHANQIIAWANNVWESKFYCLHKYHLTCEKFRIVWCTTEPCLLRHSSGRNQILRGTTR